MATTQQAPKGIAVGTRVEVREYRAAQVRSLSVGDVVVVQTPDGPGVYVCESSGWSDAALADFEIEG